MSSPTTPFSAMYLVVIPEIAALGTLPAVNDAAIEQAGGGLENLKKTAEKMALEPGAIARLNQNFLS